MSKHKTLSEKKRSQQKRENDQSKGAFTYQGVKVSKSPVVKINEDDLLVVAPKYIMADLLRTLILSILFLGLLIGLYMWTKSGNAPSFLK